jgi:hypothetical protein
MSLPKNNRTYIVHHGKIRPPPRCKSCHLNLTIMQRVLGIVAGRGTPLGLSTPVAVSAGHGIAGHPQVTTGKGLRACLPSSGPARLTRLAAIVALQGVTGPSHTRLAVEEVSP